VAATELAKQKKNIAILSRLMHKGSKATAKAKANNKGTKETI